LLIHSWRRRRRVGQGADVKLLKKGIVDKMEGNLRLVGKGWRRLAGDKDICRQTIVEATT
jgi:hypothetical protein